MTEVTFRFYAQLNEFLPARSRQRRFARVNPREAVGDELPARTRTSFHQFHYCPGCGRVYWQGSHYRRLAGLIERARQRLSA